MPGYQAKSVVYQSSTVAESKQDHRRQTRPCGADSGPCVVWDDGEHSFWTEKRSFVRRGGVGSTLQLLFLSFSFLSSQDGVKIPAVKGHEEQWRSKSSQLLGLAVSAVPYGRENTGSPIKNNRKGFG